MTTAMMMTMTLYHILVYSVRFSLCVNLSVSVHVLFSGKPWVFNPAILYGASRCYANRAISFYQQVCSHHCESQEHHIINIADLPHPLDTNHAPHSILSLILSQSSGSRKGWGAAEKSTSMRLFSFSVSRFLDSPVGAALRMVSVGTACFGLRREADLDGRGRERGRFDGIRSEDFGRWAVKVERWFGSRRADIGRLVGMGI
ncbi:hypothetical protein BDV11DRAFT_36079 [Aspergillus similis]